LRPKSYYGAGKVAAEAFIHACTATSTWQATILRPSNIYGPGQRMRRGFAIVPTLFSHASAGTTFELWGNGDAVRDYCHVSDLVDLMVETIRRSSDAPCIVCNAASGETASVLALIAACERISGRKIAIAFRPARNIDATYVPLATELTRATFGWTARTSLDEGLDQTWRSLLATDFHELASSRE
jgi:UDP-glucose 4-epimerase